jgi:hypothetical protein
MVFACSSSTGEAKEGDCKLKASLEYIARLFKKKKENLHPYSNKIQQCTY